METLQLSPEILGWAADQAGASVEELARKISKRNVEKISRGELSTAQAIQFSKLAGVPFGYLFLDTPPPPRAAPVADFGTLTEPSPLSKNFFDTYDDIEYKQTWYRQYLEAAQGDPRPFVGRFTLGVSAKDLAADIRNTLQLSEDDVYRQRTPEDLYGLLSTKAEAAGILVFKNGVVANNTHRPLSVMEFRGFVLADQWAPAIFVNGADAPAAWVFTLAHELAHIWLGDSAISDTAPATQNAHERLCNAAAAELLVPADKFLALWDSTVGDDAAKMDFVRSRIKVSTLVIARRALDLRKISKQFYDGVYHHAKESAKKRGGWGSVLYDFPGSKQQDLHQVRCLSGSTRSH